MRRTISLATLSHGRSATSFQGLGGCYCTSLLSLADYKHCSIDCQQLVQRVAFLADCSEVKGYVSHWV